MSSKIKSLRKTSCQTPNTRGKSVLLSSAKKRASDFSLLADFESETLSSSSPIKVDKTSEKKVRRKKIRSTQDFNKLGSSCTEDSDSSTKSKVRRTKKAKGIYNLPKIGNVMEDSSRLPDVTLDTINTMLRSKSKRKISEINDNKEEADHSDVVNDELKQFKKGKLFRHSKSEVNIISNSSLIDIGTFDSEIELCNGKTNHNLDRKTIEVQVDKDQSENLVITDEQKHTEQGARIKTKKKLRRKSKSDIMCRDSKDECTKPITNNYNLSDNEAEVHSPSLNGSSVKFFSEVSPFHDQKWVGSRISSTETRIKNEIQQSNNTENNFIEMVSDGSKIEARKSVRFLTSEEKSNTRRDTFDVTESTFGLTLLKSLEENSNVTDLSPNYNSICNDNTTLNFHLSPNVSTKTDGTFEVEKSHILNESEVKNDATIEKTPSKVNVSHNKTVPKKSCNIESSQKNVDVIFPKDRDVSKSRSKASTIELPSPKYSRSSTYLKNRRINRASFQKENNISSNDRQSVIDLTTPKITQFSKSINKNLSGINLEESVNKTLTNNPSVLNRESTFTVDIPVSEQKVQTPSKLNSTSDGQMQEKKILDQNYDSPLAFDISNVKKIDTSKVNKRRRWNKSQANVSFLDSINIADISAPWNEVFNASAANDSSCYLETKDSSGTVAIREDLSKSKINLQSPIAKRMGSIIRTPPTKTSTPFPRSKNILLKQTLLNDTRNVTFDESKNSSKTTEKPAAKLKRKKMPNFALIHQRAFDKMENLKEMSERKAVRAKQLLSGHKPTDQNNLKSPSKSKKFLQFSPAKSKIAPLNTSISENRKTAEKPNKSDILLTKSKNISPSTSNLKVANKENKLTLLEKKKVKPTQIPKPKVPNNVTAEKKGFTRYGFKVGQNSVKPVTKEDQMKAVTTKTKILKNTVDERRNVIRGVRSNRRFELLMQMRVK